MQFTEDHDRFRQAVRGTIEREIAPHVDEWEEAGAFPGHQLFKALGDAGLFGLEYDPAYGGQGADHSYTVVLGEELGRIDCGGVPMAISVQTDMATPALLRFGSPELKERYLAPAIRGDMIASIAVTEPDFGSDVAGVVTSAVRTEGGWLINGVKTWCTFAARADVLMLLARTDPDRSKAHRGLSLFLVEKPQAEGHGFLFTQEAGSGGRPADSAGRMEGRAIDTLGYRGMHSYEVAFENWFVTDANQVGGEDGLGKGFYLQMQGFENGRLQTAARAIGLMQAAYEAALEYARNRTVFGSPIVDYQLTQVKLARMAVLIQATRQFSYEVARLMSKGEGSLEASMVKAYVCRAAEWVTREALQIHGGMGYAEEFPVSRYFVDARVLSIFEGADETLALKVIARGLLARAKG
jgi:(2S)-methylsuccinyl-CoA dehydrogenase